MLTTPSKCAESCGFSLKVISDGRCKNNYNQYLCRSVTLHQSWGDLTKEKCRLVSVCLGRDACGCGTHATARAPCGRAWRSAGWTRCERFAAAAPSPWGCHKTAVTTQLSDLGAEGTSAPNSRDKRHVTFPRYPVSYKKREVVGASVRKRKPCSVGYLHCASRTSAWRASAALPGTHTNNGLVHIHPHMPSTSLPVPVRGRCPLRRTGALRA